MDHYYNSTFAFAQRLMKLLLFQRQQLFQCPCLVFFGISPRHELPDNILAFILCVYTTVKSKKCTYFVLVISYLETEPSLASIESGLLPREEHYTGKMHRFFGEEMHAEEDLVHKLLHF